MMTSKLKFQVVPLAEVAKDDVAVIRPEGPVVLIVDDEQVIADTLSIILTRNGFSTVTAYNGESALMLAKEVRPSLLISDVVMPRMSGVELAIAVVEMIPECKVLLFSGQAATVDLLHQAREAGHDFTTLAKPVHPTDMLRRVKSYFQEDQSSSLSRASSSESAYSVQ
jgi:DNA-binding NtrC family response regulator